MVFTLNMLCVQRQHPSLLKNTCLLKNKEVFHLSLLKDSGVLQGRKRNYRTIITSKCKKKKRGEMWVAVWGKGWLMRTQLGFSDCEIYSWCPVDSRVVQLILARAASCVLLPIKRFIIFYEVLYRTLDKGKN